MYIAIGEERVSKPSPWGQVYVGDVDTSMRGAETWDTEQKMKWDCCGHDSVDFFCVL